MSDFDPNNPSDSENDDFGSLAWNEFDWERYFREQDDVIMRYLGFYELLGTDPERIDKVAQYMGWAMQGDGGGNDIGGGDDDDADDAIDSDEPYTVHRNYIFVATKGLYLDLTRKWAALAQHAAKAPQSLAVAYQASLHEGEAHAMLAIHALDYGDFAMAVSLFKRALQELNRSLSLLDEKAAGFSRPLAEHREWALQRLFDLREIWLRMTRECRAEMERRPRKKSDDDDPESGE